MKTKAKIPCLFLSLMLLIPAAGLQAQGKQKEWEPISGRIMTRWAQEVSPDNVWPEYPRPTMVRDQWLNLNGLWEYAIQGLLAGQPKIYDGKILVPFPIESALSGVARQAGPLTKIWYRRHVRLPEEWSGKRILLHFGAVDWETEVIVNNHMVGYHLGGYDAFSFDITEWLHPNADNELVVAVWDPVDAGTQPRGKQVVEPHGIWYTSVSGIWQSVWLEPVNDYYIKKLKITADPDTGKVEIIPSYGGDKSTGEHYFRAVVKEGDVVVATSISPERITVPQPKLWSPDNPFLYDLVATLEDKDGKVLDEVNSYFGFRRIALGKDEDGYTRLMLNGKFLFQFGPLDQGWWPDGLYTPPSDRAMRYDIEVTKRLGFNMLRKHVKVEPERFYYWCDKLGVLIWQDMPSGDRHIGGDDADIKRSPLSALYYTSEFRAIIESRFNHPSIVMWVPFNEGWGQFDTESVLTMVKRHDNTRLVDCASGWADRGIGDVVDEHIYPGPAAPANEEERASVLGEFGGLGLPLRGYTWQDEKNWGYRSYKNSEELTAAYEKLVAKLPYLIGKGLSAAVYTQTSDVEIEVNGLMTYDRAMIKMDAERAAAINNSVYCKPPEALVVLPTSEETPTQWRYTTSEPAEDWTAPGFDDSAWQTGPGGFGTSGTPRATVRTIWDNDDIWMRHEFELDSTGFENLRLLIYHDEAAEVFINGVPAVQTFDYTRNYLPELIAPEAIKTLRIGKNMLAVHCRHTGGKQFIDVGLIDLRDTKK